LVRQGERVAFLGLIDIGMPHPSGAASGDGRSGIRARAAKLFHWCRVIWVMRGTVFQYLCDAARLTLDALRGRTDPAAAHLRFGDYLRWVKHDLPTQYDLRQANRALPDSQRRRLMFIHEPFVWHVFKTTHARGQAMRKYVPTLYPGRLTLFRTGDTTPADPTLGWDGIPAEGVDVRPIPGNHTVVLRKPYVEVLAGEMLKCIDAADTPLFARQETGEHAEFTETDLQERGMASRIILFSRQECFVKGKQKRR